MKKDELLSAIGIFFGIGIVALVSDSIDDNLLLAPFGATSIIAFYCMIVNMLSREILF